MEILNRSAVVLLCASWEAYIEDVATESFKFMLRSSDDPKVFPAKVRVLASRHLLEDPDGRKIWDLAGSGWKKVMEGHSHSVINVVLRDFHAPKSGKIDTLFEHLLGLRKVSNSWRWRNMTVERARNKLDGFVEVRGDIAHRVRADRSIQLSWVRGRAEHLVGLVGTTEAALAKHVRKRVGKRPWK